MNILISIELTFKMDHVTLKKIVQQTPSRVGLKKKKKTLKAVGEHCEGRKLWLLID